MKLLKTSDISVLSRHLLGDFLPIVSSLPKVHRVNIWPTASRSPGIPPAVFIFPPMVPGLDKTLSDIRVVAELFGFDLPSVQLARHMRKFSYKFESYRSSLFR